MFEPEELMARIVDLEAQVEFHERAHIDFVNRMSKTSPRADELIACLEGEIAKRDARIVELENAAESLRISRDYHHEQEVEYRRRWAGLYAAPVVNRKLTTECKRCLGTARVDIGTVCDNWVDCPECAAPVSEAKTQDTVGEVVGWYRLDRQYEMTSYPSVCATWHKLGAPVAPLYAAPAAPAADAGLVEALGYQVLFDAIAAATSVYANGAINISVQAFRAALAAHRAKGVV